MYKITMCHIELWAEQINTLTGDVFLDLVATASTETLQID